MYLNYFSNFHTDKNLKEHENSCTNHNQVELGIPQKFKTISYMETSDTEKKCGIFYGIYFKKSLCKHLLLLFMNLTKWL